MRQDEVARNAIAIIEECRADLIGTGHAWVVQVLDIALLQLSMTLNDVSDDDLKSLTEALRAGAEPTSGCEDHA